MTRFIVILISATTIMATAALAKPGNGGGGKGGGGDPSKISVRVLVGSTSISGDEGFDNDGAPSGAHSPYDDDVQNVRARQGIDFLNFETGTHKKASRNVRRIYMAFDAPVSFDGQSFQSGMVDADIQVGRSKTAWQSMQEGQTVAADFGVRAFPDNSPATVLIWHTAGDSDCPGASDVQVSKFANHWTIAGNGNICVRLQTGAGVSNPQLVQLASPLSIYFEPL